MKYKGYTIQKDKDDNYVVTTPKGVKWPDRAANTKTAKKWVDCEVNNNRLWGFSHSLGYYYISPIQK